MQITASQLTMEFIMEERERELLGEMFRWFDLKRWGVLIERVKLYNPDAAPNIKAGKHELRPRRTRLTGRPAGPPCFHLDPLRPDLTQSMVGILP